MVGTFSGATHNIGATDSSIGETTVSGKRRVPYAELYCKSNFSFLEGASHAQELVERAGELGYAALAVTDRNSLAGVVRAHDAAQLRDLPLVIGAELTPQDAPPVVLWAPDRAAYGRLARLITCGRRRATKGDCSLVWEDIVEHAEGLLAGLRWEMPARSSRPSGSDTGPSGSDTGPSGPLGSNGTQLSLPDAAGRFRELFGSRGYLLASLHRGPDDSQRLAWFKDQARRTGLPLLATGGVLYHTRARQPLHHVLTAIRRGVTVAQVAGHLPPNAQYHLRALSELQSLFASAPGAFERTMEVAGQCHFSLEELRYEYPEELAPDGSTPFEYLQQLTWRGAARRYPDGIPDRAKRLLEHELSLIRELRYEAYFLTVWDLVRFARGRNILCQGRGSAANSAVCFCLGITSVDPDRMDVLFERFVSRERDEAPDIDVDFEHERREEVLQYLYQKYGRERAGMTAVVITYRSRSAVRDVGKALGLSLDRVDALAKQVDGHADEPRLAERCRQVGIDPESETGSKLIYLVESLRGFPRHLSQHVGGMVMTRGPLCELVPIENAAMENRTVIQWDKDDLDTLGILKVDCLSLGMLSAIHRCFDMIEQHTGQTLSMARIPAGDRSVYDMICQADTIGVFQIESRAQMSMLPRLKPRCYYDLVIEVAIVRPGPIQGNMVHPYLRRRSGQETETYPNQAIREVLHKTLGVPIFQEQAMRLAVVAAGFTPGEADQLRRAMGAWRRPGVIDQFRQKLIRGMQDRGLSPEFAQQVFHQIRGFGEYGFPESHAASFALLVYVSAWLKHYYPAAYVAALINSQPMGFYAPAQLVRDARDHGVTVLPADVNTSDWDCTLVPVFTPDPDRPDPDRPRSNDNGARPTLALRLGMRLIHGLPLATAQQIMQARNSSGCFTSLQDFARRTQLGQSLIVRLSQADAFGSLQRNRRHALWEALAQEPPGKQLPLLDLLPCQDDPVPDLPPLSAQQDVFADYQTTGLSLKAHPLSFYRPALEQLGVVCAETLRYLHHGRRVSVAGLVLLRQRPGTAKGITFATLEDETGTANLVIHQATWETFYAIARRAPAWIAHGRLERKDSVIHLVVQSLENLSDRLQLLNAKARNFH